MNKDSFLLGLILGFIVPICGMLIFFTIKYMPANHSFGDFIYMMKSNHQNIPRVISLSMIAVIPLITYYKNRNRYQTLKGVFVFIVLYVLLAVCYKFSLL